MNLFKQRSVVVEAIQWTGKNFYDVDDFTRHYADWAHAAFAHADGHELAVFNSYTRCWERCPEGCYVVKGPYGEFSVMGPDIFESRYESIIKSKTPKSEPA